MRENAMNLILTKPYLDSDAVLGVEVATRDAEISKPRGIDDL